jgi:release factor glutamine methyltransferase
MAAAWRRERPTSFSDALRAAKQMLSASPELVAKGSIDAEAELLVTAAYRRSSQGRDLSRMELYARMQDRYPDDAGDRLLELAGTRAEGKPLQHLTGTQVFLDHEYEVGPDVLIPRPETEALVSLAIERLGKRSGSPRLGVEIGLGSGVISIELLSAFTSLRMIASELSPAASCRARANAASILAEGQGRLEIVSPASPLEVWAPISARLGDEAVDFIISNPPYLGTSDLIEDEVRDHEPASALFAPEADLLHFYREIACHGAHSLAPGGWVFAEVAHERAEEARALFAEGWSVELAPDLTGRNRVLIASWSGKR